MSALNLLLYKLFGESRNAHQERQDLAHAISLMTELGEAKRRNAESEPDEDAKWSITFDQIKEFFRNYTKWVFKVTLASKFSTSDLWFLCHVCFWKFVKTILFDEGSIYNFFQKTVDIETESRKILSSLSSNEKKWHQKNVTEWHVTKIKWHM